ncbi:imidazole glycerol phosphate synthase subunit HisH [Candidatus Carsonella ruddii]|uniref:Imidazole glycerol phosphate synthase subunit HisH n=1 Tax=Candidatus Carsonella ruddii (Diaphorina cf. continua) TaxID=2661587 RepID=A0A7R7ABI8_CARRU|nr:imidazole glycerol phosphate synthase subunit HisH [Candidatus Carsonella ruddii (Diaphorina cf. continua)]BCG49291.1 imidazole glycerol phosphate synthase subunit HisH [Candidatus Carsonella ruddii (Diaphorina cf. continua)]
MNVLLINYGTSNIISIYNSLKKIKKIKIYVNNFAIKNYDKIIFPGQGHIKNTMNFLSKIENIQYYIKNIHILGICIGYHIFFKNSDENQHINCFNYFNEKIKNISNNCCYNTFHPNIGWKTVNIIKFHKILKNIPNCFKQYFMHSYSSIYNNQNFSYATTNYNNKTFNSIVIKENKFLIQFHPEKSSKYGLLLIKNFLEL